MDINRQYIELEEELTWRIDELRFLYNLISQMDDEDQKRLLRRSAILMVYAHFEGYFKFCFQLYVRVINEANLKCEEVNSHVLASAFEKLFKDLRNPNKKSRVFSRPLPDDSKLHRLHRSVEFLDSLQDNLKQEVEIPVDVIDTESNLKPVVLQKILYMLGIDHELFKSEEGKIHRLLNVRNTIAHGESRALLEEDKFEEFYSTTITLLNTIKSKILECLAGQEYLRQEAA